MSNFEIPRSSVNGHRSAVVVEQRLARRLGKRSFVGGKFHWFF